MGKGTKAATTATGDLSFAAVAAGKKRAVKPPAVPGTPASDEDLKAALTARATAPGSSKSQKKRIARQAKQAAELAAAVKAAVVKTRAEQHGAAPPPVCAAFTSPPATGSGTGAAAGLVLKPGSSWSGGVTPTPSPAVARDGMNTPFGAGGPEKMETPDLLVPLVMPAGLVVASGMLAERALQAPFDDLVLGAAVLPGKLRLSSAPKKSVEAALSLLTGLGPADVTRLVTAAWEARPSATGKMAKCRRVLTLRAMIYTLASAARDLKAGADMASYQIWGITAVAASEADELEKLLELRRGIPDTSPRASQLDAMIDGIVLPRRGMSDDDDDDGDSDGAGDDDDADAGGGRQATPAADVHAALLQTIADLSRRVKEVESGDKRRESGGKPAPRAKKRKRTVSPVVVDDEDGDSDYFAGQKGYVDVEGEASDAEQASRGKLDTAAGSNLRRQARKKLELAGGLGRSGFARLGNFAGIAGPLPPPYHEGVTTLGQGRGQLLDGD